MLVILKSRVAEGTAHSLLCEIATPVYGDRESGSEYPPAYGQCFPGHVQGTVLPA